ncbi:hypothetical protein ACLOJK_041417 [Asimina triloba]
MVQSTLATNKKRVHVPPPNKKRQAHFWLTKGSVTLPPTIYNGISDHALRAQLPHKSPGIFINLLEHVLSLENDSGCIADDCNEDIVQQKTDDTIKL